MPAIKQEYIAHPANPKKGLPAQRYEEHIRGVVAIYEHRATQMLRYYSGKVPKDMFLTMGRDACLFHDLGKLFEDFQRFMNNGCEGPRINHVDPGVAYLMYLFNKSKEILNSKKLPVNYRLLMASVMIQGHHIGLMNPKFDFPSITLTGGDIEIQDFLRDNRSLARAYPHIRDDSKRVMDYTDAKLNEMLKIHKEIMPEGKPHPDKGDPAKWFVDIASVKNDYENYDDMKFTALDLRLNSSCFFFADHTDTARADGGISLDEDTVEFPLRAKERMQQLDNMYKEKFGKNNDKKELDKRKEKRNQSRQRVYDDASNCEINPDDDLFLLQANVGSGKTYAGLKFALRVAEAFGSRRIFTFPPYTTIIDQISKVYTDCLILPDEKKTKDFDNSKVVAQHHHLTLYGRVNDENSKIQLLKALTANWFAPITVSSVEQFIDSFASNLVPLIKKLNNVPGSVILIEEFHTIPIEVWSWLLYILKQLVEKWGCKIVFVSGTPINFWEIDSVSEFFGKHKVKNIISANTSRSLSMHERKRVKFSLYNNGDFSPINPFIDFACNKTGSGLIICNTTRNAAIIAQLCANKIGQENVFHISTALTPHDRAKIISKVMERLKPDSPNKNFILVGTSCIEAGIDFSFDFGFAEARSVTSTMQVSGRINRNFELDFGELFVFRLFDEGVLTRLSSTSIHESILINMMRKNPQLNKSSITSSTKLALKNRNKKLANKGREIVAAERNFALRDVRVSVKCIHEFGINVIVNPKLLELLNNKDPLSRFNEEGEPSAALCTAWELGLERNKFVTVSWLRQAIQRHSFKIPVESIDDLKKKNLPYIDLGDFWFGKEEGEIEVLEPIDKLSMELIAWKGHYDSDFLGYMNHVLLDLGIPGVKKAPIPFEYVQGMFETQ